MGYIDKNAVFCTLQCRTRWKFVDTLEKTDMVTFKQLVHKCCKMNNNIRVVYANIIYFSYLCDSP